MRHPSEPEQKTSPLAHGGCLQMVRAPPYKKIIRDVC